MQNKIKGILDLYDTTTRNKANMDRLTAEERELIYKSKKEADTFVDGLILTLNEEFDEKEVTVATQKRFKYAYLRQIHKELDDDYADEEQIFEMVRQSQMKIIKVKAQKGEHLPKEALTLGEFNAIRSQFSGTDFERNGIMPMSIFVTSALLWVVQRGFVKMKWRI